MLYSVLITKPNASCIQSAKEGMQRSVPSIRWNRQNFSVEFTQNKLPCGCTGDPNIKCQDAGNMKLPVNNTQDTIRVVRCSNKQMTTVKTL